MDAKEYLEKTDFLNNEDYPVRTDEPWDSYTDDQLFYLMEQYAKEKVKEVVKQIHSQSKDGAITSDWVGFESFID